MIRPKANLIAVVVFIVLSGITGVVFMFVDITIYAPDLFLVTTFFVIALITVIVYQSLRISENAEELAHKMASRIAKDTIVYTRELSTELYRASPVPYILIGSDGSITSMNLSALRLLNIEEGALDGQNIFSYIEGDDIHHVATFPEKLKQGLSVSDEDVRIYRADGTYRWVLLSLFPFKDPDNEIKGLLTLVDITKQKEIDRAKTEFVSLASHQLRTPIATMRWNLELFEMKFTNELSPAQMEYVTKMGTNLRRMDALVEDFLNVSRFELGTLVPEPKEVDLTAVFSGILEEQNERITTKSIHIEEAYDRNIVSIVTDEHLFRMAIGNLISNAVKYTPDGGVVTITTQGDGNMLVVTVSDTGIGIPEDDQDQIFSKIFRAANAKAKVTEGTGLGLYIVREALKVLGGEVAFVSKENVGTTFTVTLPQRS